MIDVPLSWIGEPRCKWDMQWIDRMLKGHEGLPAGGYRFVETPWTPEDGLGRVVIFPAGDHPSLAYAERLRREVDELEWCLLIATSDECSRFPWEAMRLSRWPDRCRLWVMTPRPGYWYPQGTRFIGEGSPAGPQVFADWRALTRDLDLFYSGQVGGNERRQLAIPAIRETCDRLRRTSVKVTKQFLHDPEGNLVQSPGADYTYIHGLTRAWVAPAPSGSCTQDSFRLFEALEAGCIPIADELSPHGNPGYWDMIGMGEVMPRIEFWRHLPPMVEGLLVDRCATAAHVGSRWQQYKRNTLARLYDDVEELVGRRDFGEVQDRITVLVVTSPVPSNPDLSMIKNLIESVRIDLPGAEILIGCDSVREEMEHRRAAYHHFLHELTIWANTQFNVTVFTTTEHSHESGLLHMLMPEVRTDHVLFMEHDCPLIQPIDFAACLNEMRQHDLRHLRFGHEARVLDEHAYLYPFGTEPDEDTAHIKTVQYSSRPALYASELMRELLDTYFAPGATCMIESVLYGPWQTADGFTPGEVSTELAGDPAFADRLRLSRAWERYRSALWAPGPNLAFSGHVDGRGGDPNVPILIKYPDGVVPPGAPQQGEVQI